MTRPFDWPERMIDAIAARRDTPFAWGSQDCALFACDVAKAVCGVDFAAPLRGRYSTGIGAARVLKSFAGSDAKECGLEAAVEKIAAGHDRPEVAPLMAQRGDLVLLDTLAGPALGICIGEHVATAGPEGVALLPLADVTRAWRV